MAPRYTRTTSQQQYLDSTKLLDLLSLQDSSVCCVGRTAKGPRCTKVIAKKNFEAAKPVIQKLRVRNLDKTQGYHLILKLASLTLCPGYHWDQEETISTRWFQEVSWTFKADPKRNGSSTSHDSHRKAEAEHEAEVRKAADRARREEALRQSQREKAERASNANRQRRQREADAKKKAEEAERERLRREKAEKAERDRLRREQEEKDRLKREREAKQRHRQNEQLSWEDAWDRYEKALSNLVSSGKQPTDLEINTSCFWPTRAGVYSSCNEAAVKEFFAHRPNNFDRKALRKQASQWHPDRATRRFAHAYDQAAVQRLVTMVTQVITGVMETCSG